MSEEVVFILFVAKAFYQEEISKRQYRWTTCIFIPLVDHIDILMFRAITQKTM